MKSSNQADILFFTPPRNKQQYYNSKTHLSTPSTAEKPSNQQYQENHSLVKLIGHGRLLDSFSNMATVPSLSQTQISSVVQDRFIPSRKLLKMEYSSMQCENQNDNQSKDPQMVSIAEIYSQQVLGLGADRQNGDIEYYQQEHVEQFKNNNLFKYRYTPDIISEYEGNYETDLSKAIPGSRKSKKNYSYNKLRKIAKTPCKVLDAPALQDDFYLNLIDWSQDNQLAVGLGNCIYLWNAETSKVTKLCELNSDLVTSVCWANKGSLLAVGCNKGDVCIWDVNYSKQIRKMGGHDSRVGAMTWNSKSLATGSRDKVILQRDIRSPYDQTSRLAQHTQEICGLKWSLDQQYLASGGNDNKVVVWSAGGSIVNKFTDHKAAVKALAWSPHQHGLLATGGGTADRMIKMRNIFTGKIICEKDAGSQVCNIAFSKSLHQVVSTHGYSQNQINIWSYPNMKKTATLIGHSQRVLYLAMSPDGATIVTGAGDETLRFWNVFPSTKDITEHSKNISKIEEGFTVR